MPNTQNKSILTRFLLWKTKHIPQRNFVYILSILVGLIAGLGAVTLKNLTHFIQHLLEAKVISDYHHAFYFVFPIVGLTITFLIKKYVIRHNFGHGIPSTLKAIAKKKGIMKQYQMFSALLTAPFTVGFGGSVGLEGPTVSTAAAMSSNISRLFHTNQSTRTLLIGCASTGAIACIFKAPIAAIVFAIEVFSLDLTLSSLLPLLIASISGVLLSYFFYGSDTILPFQLEDKFSLNQVPYFAFLGILTALTSIYFTKVYKFFHDYFERISSPIKRLLIGGLGLGVIVFFIPPLYGEGFDVINNVLKGNYNEALDNNFMHIEIHNAWFIISMLAGLVVFKIIASAFTFGAGGIGGIFSPSLFMGSVLGCFFAKLINTLNFLNFDLSEKNFTLVGMAGVLGGVLQAPLTAIFLIAELTGGYKLFLPLMITVAICFAITKYFLPYSVYSMELAKTGDLITHDKDQAVLTLMNLESLIEKKFVPVHPQMNLGEIVHKAVIKSNRNIFPVVDLETNALEGIILLDDIRPIMFNQELYKEILAEDVMQNAPAVIDLENDRMSEVMQKFQDSSAWNLPVISNQKYVGFISKSKLLTAYRRKLITFTQQ
ncbi:chloride channel protein [Neptunitalea lumnitzerae]|uniref:Chloride channel protein n=1 Tax=Neptunitalea lumnitzerae TaxID=2965509 RepID=A0ABQ5MHD2_9FLAO|nr:chloride channel protein [Neptunitalea sp. Y10]GLB48772.1 chloride channel protein [Neptunitalea sp. Y10]